MSSTDIEALAEALAEAHRTGQPALAASLPTPVDMTEAGKVQAAVARRLGAGVGGWKAGFAPDGERPVAAPIFNHLLTPDGGAFAWRGATFVALEVEIGFRLGAASGNGDGEPGVSEAFVGIEIVESRFAEGPAAPFLSFLADNIANGGYVIGQSRADWRGLDLSNLRCRVWRDGELTHDAVGGHPQGNPVAPLAALRSHPVDRLGGLANGQFVTTGTLCGVMRITEACSIRAEVEGFGEVAVDLRP